MVRMARYPEAGEGNNDTSGAQFLDIQSSVSIWKGAPLLPDIEGVALRMPISISAAVGTCDDDMIPIWISHPAFPVIWAAIAVGRVAVPWDHDLDIHLCGTLQDCVYVIHFKPKQNPVPIWLVVRISYPAMMMFDIKAVQLKHQFAAGHQLFIGAAAVIASQPKQTLIPAATCFHVLHCDQRLNAHASRLSSLRISQGLG